jgi:hypothetical protein
MKRIEYRYQDKTGWGPGPWQDEPDKVQWTDPATGLPCLAVRNNMGALCGYVGVDESHPLFGVDCDEVDVKVHGGLTFSNRCAKGEPEHGICHKPDFGESDVVWWFGFDCSHLYDLSPQMSALLSVTSLPRPPYKEEYRDLSYVQDQCTMLARQLKEAGR